MRTYLKNASLVLVLALVATQAFAQVQPQVINIPLSRPGEPIELDISILSARIEVIGEDREDATFEVVVEEGARKIITPSGTQSLKNAAFSLEVQEKDNRISVDTDWRAKKVNVVARVPAWQTWNCQRSITARSLSVISPANWCWKTSMGRSPPATSMVRSSPRRSTGISMSVSAALIPARPCHSARSMAT